LAYRNYPAAGPLLIGYDPYFDLDQRHLARKIDEIVDESIEVAPRPDEAGQPPYDPRLLVKVLLLAYATGQRSSRQIERLCKENLAFRFLTRGDTPSHSVISSARTSLSQELEQCWKTMLGWAEKNSLRRVGRIDLDSTKIRANVSMDSVIKRSNFHQYLAILLEILAEARRQDEREDVEGDPGQAVLNLDIETCSVREVLQEVQEAEAPEKKSRPVQMREILRHARKRLRRQKAGDDSELQTPLDLGPGMVPRLEAAVVALETAIETNRNHVSLTDPDAQIMGEGRHKRLLECHSFEVAVDSGFLVAAQTSQSQPDNGRLLGLVDAAQEQEPDGITEVTADSGYFGSDAVVALEESGISTCIPDSLTARDLKKGLPIGSTSEARAGAVKMTYDEEHNGYRCEQGKLLRFEQQRKSEGKTVTVYRAESDCTDCPLRSQCMTNKDAKRRMLKVGIDNEHIRQILSRFNNQDQRRRYHCRGKNVETVFAFSRSVLGFNRWMLRGKNNIAAEGALLAAAYQVRKLHAANLAYG